MTHHRVAPTALGLLLVLVGLVVGTGGVWLMALGGSWYYLPAGLLLVLTGLLLLQGNPAALPTHALLLGLTLAWSLWESGLNAWALAARGDVLWVLGLVMATPWFLRGLDGPVPRAARHGLATSLALFAAAGLAALLQPATAEQGVFGLAPASAATTTGNGTAQPRPIELAQPLSAPLPPVAACPGALRVSAVDGGRAAAFTAVHGPDCAVGQREAEDGDSLVGLSPSQPVTGADMWGLTLIDHLACRIAFERMRFDSRFTRPLAPGQRLQTPAPAGGRQLVMHGPSALMYTAQVVVPTRSAKHAAQAADALARLAQPHPSEGAATAQPAPERNGPGAMQLADGSDTVWLQPFVSPIGLPCQTPPWRLQAAAEPAESGSVTTPAAPPPLRSGSPMAAAQVPNRAAL